MKKIILIPSYEPDEKLIELINKIDQKEFNIVIVNDGSKKEYDIIFNRLPKNIKLISYQTNKGKGYALKKGLEYIKETWKDNYIVITMDSDGQHRIEDAQKLCNYSEKHPNALVLGKRKRLETTPIRSKIGNTITRSIYKLTTGLDIYDTQTGLRTFTNQLIDFLLKIEGERFEYEMNVLLLAAKNKIPIKEIEIKTIYIENNKKSHFKTIKDSILVYKEIIKFSLSSIISFIIDYILFIILSTNINISISTIIARIISSSINFILNKKIVFNSKNNLKKEIINYIKLAITILLLNIMIINILTLVINKPLAKLLTEFILFIANYHIQKRIIFNKNTN